ncbi:hypothetical protein ACI77I_25875 [Pseudomonas sp. D47]|uniref:hypothetical protein n=1 Tax=Pseudomonas sp. D47 TaxID=3159447 RepID=UPI00387A9A7A
MLASTNCTSLKVLTPTLAERLRIFNAAARQLQAYGVRIQGFHPTENLLLICAEDGRLLLDRDTAEACLCHLSAGSTRYNLHFQGVILEWREPISANHPSGWSHPTLH